MIDSLGSSFRGVTKIFKRGAHTMSHPGYLPCCAVLEVTFWSNGVSTSTWLEEINLCCRLKSKRCNTKAGELGGGVSQAPQDLPLAPPLLSNWGVDLNNESVQYYNCTSTAFRLNDVVFGKYVKCIKYRFLSLQFRDWWSGISKYDRSSFWSVKLSQNGRLPCPEGFLCSQKGWQLWW